MLTIPRIVFEASFVVVIVAGVVGLLRFRHLQPPLHYLLALVLFTAGVEVVSRIRSAHYQSNLFLLPLDTLVEFGLLALTFRRVLAPAAISRWLPRIIVVFAAASLISYADPTRLFRFNTLQRFIESLLLIMLALIYFHKLIRELVVVQLERDPFFWISVGLLIYFSGNLFVFVSGNYIIQHSNTVSLQLWGIHAVLYMVLYGLYAWALWVRPSTKR